jgi:AraC-like DNA-binding protein
VVWLHSSVNALVIDDKRYENVAETMFFLCPEFNWKVEVEESGQSYGYVLCLSEKILSSPELNRLQISDIRIMHNHVVHIAQLSPGIEKRVQAILEMIDELLSSNLGHREDAIIALISAFFVYTDGQCNIKSSIDMVNSKSKLVYRYKKLLNQHVNEFHSLAEYASVLNVSPKYLNECVRDVIGVSAKSMIIEQLELRARHSLKFTDKSVKEIAFDLGFSSPDYFSSFCRKHIGKSPRKYRTA